MRLNWGRHDFLCGFVAAHVLLVTATSSQIFPAAVVFQMVVLLVVSSNQIQNRIVIRGRKKMSLLLSGFSSERETFPMLRSSGICCSGLFQYVSLL